MDRPADQDQRRLITEQLHENIFVEAAAGTGKTTCLVDRMVHLVASGTATVPEITAVTFTRKAAAELRLRFSIGLQAALAKASDSTGSERLQTAVEQTDQAFVGTIHAFCARLLRERPFDAGLDPEFSELPDAEDQQLVQRVWREHIDRLLEDDDPVLAELEEVGLKLTTSLRRPSGLLTELEEVGLEPAELGPAFVDAARFPDVTEWPAEPQPMPDWSLPRQQVEEYVAHMAQLEFPDARGNDKLMAQYEAIVRKSRHVDLDRLPEFMELVDLFRGVRTVQKEWPSKDMGKREKTRYEEFLADVVRPLQVAWRQHRYSVCLRVIRPALALYDEQRAQLGRLSFADLLMKTAELLRTRPDVRRWCRQRFPRLLVDEFQDTDPIQAEVMLLLTADDPAETNWQACRPVPGALFVVGDPRQSIYRFRRADILVFQKVREIMIRHGGQLAVLSTGFRSVPGVTDFVNQMFSHVFPAAATDFSPAFVEHTAFRTDVEPRSIQTLTTPGGYGGTAADHARQVARMIATELAEQKSISRTASETAVGLPPHVVPADYLLVGRYSGKFRLYERALRDAGVPCEVTGAGSMADVPELTQLQHIVEAVSGPRCRIALLAVLRSRGFGFSDVQLYDYQATGCEIRYQDDPPADLSDDDRRQFQSAFARLRHFDAVLRSEAPGRALRRVAESSGLLALAASEDPAGFRLGSLLKAIDYCAQLPVEHVDVASRLTKLIEQAGQHDAIAAQPVTERPVRLMTLHQCKGLEAGIVILIDPTGESDRPITHHVSREDTPRGYLPVYGRQRSEFGQRRLLAEPQGWESLEETEREFLQAEHSRLLYVAATRARNRLVVCMPQKAYRKNPWEPFREFLSGADEVVVGTPPLADTAELSGIRQSDAAGTAAGATQRWQSLMTPTWQQTAIKSAALPTKAAELRGEQRMGAEWGNAVHEVLDRLARRSRMTDVPAVSGTGNAAVKPLCETALRQHGLPQEWLSRLEQTVQNVIESDLWRRGQAAERLLSEVPVTQYDDAHDPPQLLRGVLDLVIQDAGEAMIVDYKSERIDDPAVLAQLVDYYAPQLRAYAGCWEKMTADPVTEIGVFFTHTGSYVAVSR